MRRAVDQSGKQSFLGGDGILEEYLSHRCRSYAAAE
jgi:hypothetical protein